MNLADLFFLGFAGVTILGAVLAVSLKNVFYNALSLILCLFGLAGLFVFLNAEFLAVMEVIIYIGAISVAILFAIMLTRNLSGKDLTDPPAKLGRAIAAAGLFFAVVFQAVMTTRWPRGSLSVGSIAALGHALTGVHVLPFEIISVVLLVAIIGALVLSEKERTP